ncbi:MAG: endonuclease MutS2 [Eubacteriales bacterium]
MQFSEKTLTTLEFDKIRAMLAACAPTEGARKQATSLTPSADVTEVIRRLRHTSDAKRLIEAKGMPSFGNVKDMSKILERARLGAILTTRELLDVANLLRTTRSLLEYIRTNKLFETSLDGIFANLTPQRQVEEHITSAILAEDQISDSASPQLSDIRRKIRAANNKIKDLLSKYTSGAYSKYLQENIVTQRSGRYVIPVKTECKNDIKGLIHDTSASGATIFVEPYDVVEANNELRELESAEFHEIEKILAGLSSEVDSISDNIWQNYRNITELAFIFACGELSFKMKGIAPAISGDKSVFLRRARHPLIDRDKVVPVDIEIGRGRDTLIITGPNTGGKTVSLKTLGLLTLMVQSGLHIPVDEPSEICVFDNVLADIGDEQSIEQSLSTFSAHMVNIVSIIRQITDRSLVLFDELGIGTDPIEGAALAVAIIEAVRAKGAICAATTHYAELKAYALETEGVDNASCEFDIETLRPTYRLIIGTPGKSNAFAISEKLGLPAEIIERAGRLVSPDSRRFENVIEKLEKSRIEMERDREEIARMRAEYEKFKAEAEKKLMERQKQAEAELERARAKARAMVESARASSDFIFARLEKAKREYESERSGQALERARQEIRAHLRAAADKYDPIDKPGDEDYKLPRPLGKGDMVYLRNLGSSGRLAEAPDKSGNVTVEVGGTRIKTNIKNLKLIEEGEALSAGQGSRQAVSDEHVYKPARVFSPEIDLRGMTGEEAWYVVDRYIDEAILVGVSSVRLIHGKGTGALKNALWRFLRGDKRVANFRLGAYGEGDSGVTVLELK